MSESPFALSEIREQICESLSVQDAVKFLTVLQHSCSDCEIIFVDPLSEKRIILQGINSKNIARYRQIRENGLNQKLIQAIRKGDTNQAQKLLRLGADPKASEKSSSIGQMVAIPAARMAWAGTPTINQREVEKSSDSLFWAVLQQNQELVSLLIDHGANPNSEDKSERTPLSNAIRSGDFDMFRLLISKGADINYQNSSGQTVLIKAIEDELPEEFIAFLLSEGVDVNIEDDDGNTALSLAQQFDEGEIVELLIAAEAE